MLLELIRGKIISFKKKTVKVNTRFDEKNLKYYKD